MFSTCHIKESILNETTTFFSRDNIFVAYTGKTFREDWKQFMCPVALSFFLRLNNIIRKKCFFLLDTHTPCQFIVGVRHCDLGGWNPLQLKTRSAQIVKRPGRSNDGSNGGGGGAPADHFFSDSWSVGRAGVGVWGGGGGVGEEGVIWLNYIWLTFLFRRH